MKARQLVPLIFLFVAPAGAATPITVSPGAPDRAAVVEARCPTFSWALVREAEAYEVSVFAVDGAGHPQGESPVLRQRLPEGVASWTPSLDACLERQGNYVWVVTVVADQEALSSEPRFFRVASIPEFRDLSGSEAVVRAVPELLAPTANPDLTTNTDDRRSRGSAFPDQSQLFPGATALLATVIAAVHAEQPDTIGDTAGVVGISRSPDGAGVLAANGNTIGGADLVLDGSVQGLADTALSESGLVAGGALFDLTNAGSDLDLTLNGSSVTTEATDDDTLAGLSCSEADQVAKWDGAQWLCLREESAFGRIAPDTGSQPLADIPGDVLSITGAGNITVHGPGGDGVEISVVGGPGSGLDADTVDGLEGSAFAGAGHDHLDERWQGPNYEIAFRRNFNGFTPALAATSDALTDGLYGEGSYHGVRGKGGVGVLGVSVGSYGHSATGYGGHFTNTTLHDGGTVLGSGLFAGGNHDDAADIVLGGSDTLSDDGRIWSDPRYSSSDIFLVSNDAVVIQLEADGVGSDEDADFEVRRNDGTVIFGVDDTNGVTILNDLVVNGTFSNPSDRARKENVALADVQEILERVAAMPIARWNYIHDEDDTPHLGPMAQDFRAAFGLGADERYIAAVDADGVALAAVKGLYQVVQEQRGEIERLNNQMKELRQEVGR